MVSRVLLATPELTLGEFVCASGDRLWDEVNDIGARPHVVFPRTRVLIAQDGAQPVLATPNHVVFYRPHQRYRRGLRDTRGDRSLWLEVAPRAAASAAARRRRAARRHVSARRRPRRYVAEPEPDRLLAEETALRLLGRAVASGPPRAGAPARPHPRRPRRARRGRQGAAGGAHGGARCRCASLAAALHVSPFHLARVFRARTGFSLSGYVHGLRLRAAVDRLAADPGTDLSRLAARARLLLAQPLLRSLPRDVRPPAVGAARRRTAHDRGSGPRRCPRRTAPTSIQEDGDAAGAWRSRRSAWRCWRRRSAAASNGFVERVSVLHEWHGEAGGYLGWAVSRARGHRPRPRHGPDHRRAVDARRRPHVGVLGPHRAS